MGLSRKSNKKAMVGVSTLIIFISSILTAAVAAAVIVRTVGVLQERSYTVTTEIKDRLVTALDVITVTGYANTSQQTMSQFELMVRTRAGSYAYSLGSMGLSFVNDKISMSARLQHTTNEDFGPNKEGLDISRLLTANYVLPDMDRDYLTETVRILEDGNGTNEILLFNFSSEGIVNISLNTDISAAGDDVYMIDTPIVADSGNWLGFIQLNGTTDVLDINMDQTESSYFRITHYPERNICEFDRLIPEREFCYVTRLGDGDPAVSKGEIYLIRFRVLEENSLDVDESFEIRMIPKKGDFTEVTGQTPDSFTRDMSQIWPTYMGA